MLDRILETAEDIVVINKSKKDKVVFAFLFKGEITKHYFDKTLANKEENKVDGSKRFWKYDPKKGLITGSSTILTLRLDEELRTDGLWIPTAEEAMFLDKNKKLPNNVYRDYGIVVFNDDNPNKDVAKRLIKEANKRVYQLPILVPFKALKLIKTGTQISFNKDAEAIISGEEAKQYLENEFGHKGESGVCRLYRGRNGDWGAYWNGLDYSDDVGRVDFVCGEATRPDLTTAYENLIKRQYDVQIKELATERDEKLGTFIKSLKR